ncbi:extracellular solute-binding protein [Microbacterium mitrae]|uniref:Extracellular solute-binding protein n=1 Tax=Microbacterium mitrae TaxID=664640 RepID=A0A5C8HMC3_9MICO|nr:extracellular solute-binding protein [Microbacterium mitrae]TXK02496.1 extracellular solute-binding protein [Microbacterium mitrae]
MRQRSLAVGAIALSSALLLSACAPSASSGGSADPSAEEVTLTVWSWRTEDIEKYNKIFDVYEEAHPGVTVEFEAFQNTEYNQILTTGLAGSDGPDIPMVRAYGQLQPNIQAGQLEPIDGKVEGLDAIAPSVLAGAKGKEDGKTYAVPLATQTLQMFYNKGIFEEQGLEVPTTWDEFIALNTELKDAGITPIALGAKDAWILPIFADIVGSARYGGTDFEAAVLDGSKDFTDADYVASLQVVSDMQEFMVPDVVGVSYADSQIQFTSGQAAQFPGGSFEIATFTTQAPDMEIGSYQVPLPPKAVSDTPISPAYADGNFAINSKSKNKDAAFELLNWMATAEFGQLVADELNQFSAIPGVNYADPVMKEAWSNYQDGPASYLLLVNFRYGEPQGTAVLGEQIQKMFMGDADPTSAATALQTGVSQWFTPTP